MEDESVLQKLEGKAVVYDEEVLIRFVLGAYLVLEVAVVMSMFEGVGSVYGEQALV